VPDGQDRGNCGGRTGDYGEKLLNCSVPVDQLPLNARGEAWLKYVDIFQSPTTAECSQLGLPALLTDGVYISASPGPHPRCNTRPTTTCRVPCGRMEAVRGR